MNVLRGYFLLAYTSFALGFAHNFGVLLSELMLHSSSSSSTSHTCNCQINVDKENLII